MKQKVQTFDEMLKSQGYMAPGGDFLTGDAVIADLAGDLAKALSTTNSGPGGIVGGPLMLENLDGVMTEVLITEEHFKLYNMLPKVPSAQPFYEYNKHKGYGSRRGSLGFREGGAPKGGVSSFERKGEYTKFLGVKGGITHQMLTTGQMGGAFEDPTVRENRDRTMEMLERLERELIFGQEAIKDENGVEVNMNGLLTELEAVNSDNVVDMEGAAFGFEQLDESALDLVTTGKQATVSGYSAIMSAHVSDGINKQYQDRNIVRHNKDSSIGAEYTPGFKVPAYENQFGKIGLDHSILMEEVEGSAPLEVADASAPAASAAASPAAASEATSKLEADTYYYFVSAFNDSGESLTVASGGQAATVGQKITLTITRVDAATGYRIYRSTVDDVTTARWIGRITQPASGNATFIDLNGWRTVDAAGKAANGLSLVIKPDSKDITIAQLAPLAKMPLPQVDTTFPFLLLLYIVLVLKAPERIRIYKNCGAYTPQ